MVLWYNIIYIYNCICNFFISIFKYISTFFQHLSKTPDSIKVTKILIFFDSPAFPDVFSYCVSFRLKLRSLTSHTHFTDTLVVQRCITTLWRWDVPECNVLLGSLSCGRRCLLWRHVSNHEAENVGGMLISCYCQWSMWTDGFHPSDRPLVSLSQLMFD